MSSRLTAAGGSETRGSMTVSGKCTASSSSSATPDRFGRAGRRPRPSRASGGIDRAAGTGRLALSLEVVHDRRDEDPVLVLADPLERPHELPRMFPSRPPRPGPALTN